MPTSLSRQADCPHGLSPTHWRAAVRSGNRALRHALQEVSRQDGPGPETNDHCRRTQRYVRRLAQAVKDHPRFAERLAGDAIELICAGARHHDIGKSAIPAHILLKPGKLTPAEYETMKRHPAIGRDIVDRAQALQDAHNAFLRYVREIAYCHHERWDGSGYPRGLAHDAIPLSARLMAIADVYDAIVSRRVYKDPHSHQEAARLIADGRGRHFDPDLADAFRLVADDFLAISCGGKIGGRAA